jgi:hypothetical protein
LNFNCWLHPLLQHQSITQPALASSDLSSTTTTTTTTNSFSADIFSTINTSTGDASEVVSKFVSEELKNEGRVK